MIEEENSSIGSLPVQIVYESSSESEEEVQNAQISDNLYTRPLQLRIKERDYNFVLTPKKTSCYFKKVSFNLLARTPQLRQKRVESKT